MWELCKRCELLFIEFIHCTPGNGRHTLRVSLTEHENCRPDSKSSNRAPPHLVEEVVGELSHCIGSVLVLQRPLDSPSQRRARLRGLVGRVQCIRWQHHWWLVRQVQWLHRRSVKLVDLQHVSAMVRADQHLVCFEPRQLNISVVSGAVWVVSARVAQQLSAIHSNRSEHHTAVVQDLVSTVLIGDTCSCTRVVSRVRHDSVQGLLVVAVQGEGVGDTWQCRLDQELIDGVVESRAGEHRVGLGRPRALQLRHVGVGID